jgi:hypothetical protein
VWFVVPVTETVRPPGDTKTVEPRIGAPLAGGVVHDTAAFPLATVA